MKTQIVITTLLLSLFFVACDDIKSDDGSSDSSYDQLLSDEYDYVILASLENLENKLADLKTSSSDFISNYNQTNYDDLVEKYDSAYLAYQLAAPNTGFFINGLDDLFNKFRIDTTTAKTLISNNSYSFTSSSQENANGFPMLDYLLFSDSDPLAYFQADSKRGNLLDTLVGYLYTQISSVKTNASNSKNAFLEAGGTDVGSSVNSQLNKMLDYYEAGIRENKVGLHIGLEGPNDSRNTDPDTSDIEAQFRGYADGDQSQAIALLRRAIQGIENIYLGRGLDGTDYQGYDDILKTLGDKDIDSDIKAQFVTIYTEIDSKTKLNDYDDRDLYDKVQALVTIFKNDLFQALNVTENDELGNDGD